MFYAVLALMAAQAKETSKHSGVISFFDREYVKAGLADRRFSRWLHNAFDLRQKADYGDHFPIQKQDVEELYEHAAAFLRLVDDIMPFRLS